jgi:manganese oxidase
VQNRDAKPNLSRRRMFREGAVLATTAVAVAGAVPSKAAAAPAGSAWARSYSGRKTAGETKVWEPGVPGTHYSPVVVPDGATLPYRVVDGVKVFHLIAQEV